jgi:hypothetical protein
MIETLMYPSEVYGRPRVTYPSTWSPLFGPLMSSHWGGFGYRKIEVWKGTIAYVVKKSTFATLDNAIPRGMI